MKERSPFAGKSVIIMDFDGTVADTSDIHSVAFERALRDYPVFFQYKKYAGWRTEDVFRDLLQEFEDVLSEEDIYNLVRAKREYTKREFERRLRFVPGAESFIDRALSTGYRLCLATCASSASVSQAMKVLGLDGKFELVITADDITLGKPDPQIYLKSLKKLGESAIRSIVIEDAISGVMSAVRAGIDVICIDESGDLKHEELSTKVIYMTYCEMERNL